MSAAAIVTILLATTAGNAVAAPYGSSVASLFDRLSWSSSSARAVPAATFEQDTASYASALERAYSVPEGSIAGAGAAAAAAAVASPVREESEEKEQASTFIPAQNYLWKGVSVPLYKDSAAKLFSSAGKPAKALFGQIKYTIGNPVLTGTVNIYNIFYGTWSNKQIAIIENFFDNVGSSQWYTTNTKYYSQASRSADKVYVSKDVVLAKSIKDSYSRGTVLNGTAIPDIIEAHINAGHLPADSNAIYFFLSSEDVKESIRSDLGRASFCSEYCGYHVSWELKASKKRIFYAMTGNPASCLDGCSPPQNLKASPNGDLGVDALISVIGHELVEAVSDPVSDVNSLRSWQDGSGYENGDKCAYKYGTVLGSSGNGGSYNAVVGNMNYMIQMNWDPATQACSQGTTSSKGSSW